jgi:hypothetical protein
MVRERSAPGAQAAPTHSVRPRPHRSVLTFAALSASLVPQALSAQREGRDDASGERPPVTAERLPVPSDLDKPRPFAESSLLPEWFDFGGRVQLRYEHIDGQFRPRNRFARSDDIFVSQTTVHVGAHSDLGAVFLEGLDARQFGAGTRSVVNAGVVDTFAILQGYGELELGRAFGGRHRIRAGRETLDLGSRRLVARQIYRNAIGSFTGLDWSWRAEDGTSDVRAFWTMPVRRLPEDLDSVLDNDVELDQENIDQQFFGVFSTRELPGRVRLELYAFGLYESMATHRELFTPGARLWRKPKVGELDFDVEAVVQLGNSRAVAGGRDLTHSASFVHAACGYTFAAPWDPNLRISYDFASGDRNRNDSENNRFDPLFGVPRPEYGPGGLYDALFRTNLSSPEVRCTLHPRDDVDAFVAWRGAWLASETDAWGITGVADPSGAAGNHVGQQVEVRIGWDVLPKELRFEIGGAYLIAGGFQKDAPNGRGSDTSFVYAQTAWTF